MTTRNDLWRLFKFTNQRFACLCEEARELQTNCVQAVQVQNLPAVGNFDGLVAFGVPNAVVATRIGNIVYVQVQFRASALMGATVLGTLDPPFRPTSAVTFVVVNTHESGVASPFNTITISTAGTVTSNNTVGGPGILGDTITGSFLYVI